MRNAFVKTLIRRAKQDPRIVLLSGDLGFMVFEEFIARFPTRFINVGIAEANMVGIAAGLAKTNKIPIVYSIATFVTMRAFEQIRNDAALSGIGIKIVGVGGGFSYGHAGPTHHSIEDIALMRSVPSMTILAPSDPPTTAWATNAMLKVKGPVFLRLGKSGEPVIHLKTGSMKVGRGIMIQDGRDVSLITGGPIVSNVLSAALILKKRGIYSRIIDIQSIKPIDRALIVQSAKRTKFIFTVEEHSIIGGLGSAVAETLSEECRRLPYTFKRIGISDSFCLKVGDQSYLRKINLLSPEAIAKTIIKTIKK